MAARADAVVTGGRRHIAIICPGCGGTGSVGNVALHHAAELATYARISLLSDSFPEKGRDGVEFVRLRPRRYDWMRRFAHVPNEIAFALAARRAIEQLVREFSVNLIICHGHPVATLAAAPLKKCLGLPYGLVTHGDIFDRPKGTYDPRLTWFYRRMTGPAYRRANLVVALSSHFRDMAIGGGAEANRVVIVPNAVDPAEIGLEGHFPQPECHEPGMPLELLYVGRLSREKGMDILLEACGQLAAKNVEFHLKVVGSGPEEPKCHALADRLGLGARVEFFGEQHRHRLGAFFQSSHLVCVPSRSESFGIVVLEAMAAGTPVVGARTGGISDLVTDSVDGLLFAPEDSRHLARLLHQCALDPELVRRMASVVRHRAAARYDWTAVGQRLFSAIQTWI